MKTSLCSPLPRRAAALVATSHILTGVWGLLLLGACSGAHAVPKPAVPEPLRLTGNWTLQDAVKVSQTGDAISQTGYPSTGWYRATVPGTVLTTLVNNGVYPEPLYGENNRPDKIPDTLCRTTYWYRTPFTVPQAYAGKQVWLNFEGINYIAEVWVNGQQVGSIKGAFTRGRFDVTRLVKMGGPNALAVHVLPQPHPGETHEKTVATGTGPNGGITGVDGPTFLCSIGWDWIPTIRDRDTGIWQDVTLSATGPVVVQDPFVTSDLPLPRTDTADLTVHATVSNATDTAQSGVLSGVIEGIKFQQELSLAPKEARTLTFSPANVSALHVRKPRLWWPNGYGPQNLYKLHLAFAAKGAVSDEQDVTFGIRKITYALPGSDNLALSVNGVPVITKGG
ncbi:MAG TPA: beta galactosidase jelly roll domain-containing protein, partial [Bacillota bacterium]|nr:beta galactosidase jelly roll domain-containing protein [Bacillota bacterium]